MKYKNILRIVGVTLIGINIFFCSWSAWHQDLLFIPDIARDFFILQEIGHKKLVLLGPRSSAMGLFHGPLWAYLNYPAYWLGKGNPVVVAQFWVFLIALVSAVYFYIAYKLFDELTAWVFVILSSLYFSFHANALFNPHGAFFVLPIFFYLFVEYIRSGKLRFLILHVLVAGAAVSFQMAVGIPFLILSLGYIVYHSIKNKKKKHLLVYLLLLIPLSTFAVFELRHGFTLTHFALRQVQQMDPNHTMWEYIYDRIKIAFIGTEFLRSGIYNVNVYASVIFLAFLLYQIKSNHKYKNIYLLFLYFYGGFYWLSLLNKYFLLYFYIFPIFPFVFLVLSSLISGKKRYLIIPLLLYIYLGNLTNQINYLRFEFPKFTAINQYSWKGLYEVASQAFAEKEEFGYFVFSPDTLAYEPRYAMEYARMHFQKTGATFEKRPITYTMNGPENTTSMSSDWWLKNRVSIWTDPVEKWTYKNGYTLEKYTLTDEEVKQPFDQGINPGLHFR